MIKLIAVDMDGTLLDANRDITPHTVSMIHKANENGIQFMINTGREYDAVKTLLDKKGLKCACILMNGAEYRDENGKLLKELGMDKERAGQIIEILKKENITARIYTQNGIFTLDTKEEALKEMVYRSKSFEPGLTEEQAYEKASKEPYFLALQYIKEDEISAFLEASSVKKFVAFHSDVELLNHAKQLLRVIPNIAVSSSFIDNMEVTDNRAQKGIVLKDIITQMGLKEEEVMVMGDSFNDETMFLEFSNSVAMENAIEPIKDMAKYVTKSNKEEGVAFAIGEVINGNWGK